MKQIALLTLAFLALFCLSTQAQTDFKQYTITDGFTKGYDVYPQDINQDGHQDVVAVGMANGGEVAWWKNDGEQNFTYYSIRQNFDGARSVRAEDLDGDGDIDIIAAAWLANAILWWENDGNESWTEHEIDPNFIGAHTVDIKDVNDDGFVDVLCSGFDYYGHEGEIAWWESDGQTPIGWEKHLISDRFQQSPFIYGADMDGDQDIDVIACGELNDEVYWYENLGNESFLEHMIDENFDAAHTVLARDIDGDDDLDILGAACMSSKLAWYENKGYNDFEKHELGAFPGALWLDAIDVDMDGDMDMVCAGMSAPKLAIWENMGDGEFIMHFINSSFTSAFVSVPAHIDDDEDMDIVAIGYNPNKISWFSNQILNPDYLEGPESVAFDHDRQRYLVSSSGMDCIVAIDKTTHQQEIFQAGMNAPLGNCIMDDVLYVSHDQTLSGYSLEDGEEVFTLQIPCIQHLDGMTHDNNGFLYVIDTGGKIHKVDVVNNSYETIVDSGLSTWIQDCIFDPFNNRLLSVGYVANAPIQAINLETYEVTTASATPFGYYDGITIDQYGNVYLASHYTPGKIIQYLADFSSYEVISTGHDEPAGLDFNQYDKMLVVPNFSGNSVDFIQVEVTGYIELPSEINPIKVFPNPNNGKFILKFEIPLGDDISISLMNTTGKQVLNKKLIRCSSDKFQSFDLTSFPKGVYFLKLNNSGDVYSEKIIVR
jgi:hypothetical protein